MKFICIIIILSSMMSLYSAEQVVLTKDILVSSVWGPETFTGKYFDFNNNLTCGLGIKGEGMDYVEGKYSIEKNGLNTDISYSAKLYKNGRLFYDKESITFEYFLKFDNGEVFYKLNETCKPDKSLTIDDTACISTGYKKGVSNENLKLRLKPSVEAKTLTFTQVYSIDDQSVLAYMPKSSRIYILARTKVKYKANDLEDYWYYIIPDPVFNNPDNAKRAWVFGKFIKYEEWK
jgi:hypothetical protein